MDGKNPTVTRIATAILCLAALAVGGCGSAAKVGEPADSSNSAAPESKPKPAGPAAEPVDVTDAQIAAAYDRFAGKTIFCGAREKPWVALTFDDGPGPYTKHMLALLRKHDVPATFFVVGRNVKPYKSSLLAEKGRRMPIGNHSWSHPLLTQLSAGEQKQQIGDTTDAIEQATGDPVRLFRPPYGAHDATTDKITAAGDLSTILWNVDSEDALGASSKKIARSVKKGLTPGSIILLHENRGQTVRALHYTILPYIKKSGMTPVTVPQMLAGNPPSDEQLARGRKGCR